MHQQTSPSDLAVTAFLHSREVREQKDYKLHDHKPLQYNQMVQSVQLASQHNS